MKRLLALMFVAALALTGTVVSPASADAASQRANAATIAKIVDAHNAIRAEHNLPALKFVPKVSAEISQPWTLNMQRAGAISHNANFRYPGARAWGENVGWNVHYADPVAEVMDAWMDSTGHRRNILDAQYDLIAVGATLSGGELYATVNFYQGPLNDGGTRYDSGLQWQTVLAAGANPTNVAREDDVYSKDGTYVLNNRLWRVACEPYSRTERCRTDIWGTQVATVGGHYQRVNGWTFNNLTYAPMTRSTWGTNPLVVSGEHTINGRQWRTECNTPATGRNGCRSYIRTDVVSAVARPGGGFTYNVQRGQYVFNNIVRYT